MLDLKCFDAIGFKAPDFQEFNHFLDVARLKGQHPSSERGTYVYWPVGSGIELWAAQDRQLAQLNTNPHFVGNSRVEVRVLEMVDTAPTLEGELRVHLNPNDPSAPHYPFFINMPSWDLTRPMLRKRKAEANGPLIICLQLTAFAEELECFADQEAFVAHELAKRQREHELLGMEPTTDPIAVPPQFIPTGLMVEKGEKPLPRAAFSGEVVSGHVIENSITKQKTLHLGVKTLGMTLDVVADAEIVKGRPKHHGIVAGHFWLSGRLVEEIEATNKRLGIRKP